MHLSRGAKTAPDLNINGRHTGEGETKVSLPPGSDTPGGKSPFSAIMEEQDLALSVLLPPASLLEMRFTAGGFQKQEETSMKVTGARPIRESESSVEPERGNA